MAACLCVIRTPPRLEPLLRQLGLQFPLLMSSGRLWCPQAERACSMQSLRPGKISACSCSSGTSESFSKTMTLRACTQAEQAAREFNAAWDSRLQLLTHDCRSHTQALVRHLAASDAFTLQPLLLSASRRRGALVSRKSTQLKADEPSAARPEAHVRHLAIAASELGCDAVAVVLPRGFVVRRCGAQQGAATGARLQGRPGSMLGPGLGRVGRERYAANMRCDARQWAAVVAGRGADGHVPGFLMASWEARACRRDKERSEIGLKDRQRGLQHAVRTQALILGLSTRKARLQARGAALAAHRMFAVL